MATALRPIGHDERLSLTDHLTELRTRLIICAIGVGIAFGFCFWQNGPLLHLLNRPLERSGAGGQQKGRLAETARVAALQRQAYEQIAGALRQLRADVRPGQRPAYDARVKRIQDTIAALPSKPPKKAPVTLGVGEPFTTTLKVSAYFALLFALPLLLFQTYSFVLPAFSPRERKVAMPLMLMVPVLFILGVVFTYYAILPPAVKFLQGFNSKSFDVLVQARDYYSFEILMLVALGLLFQMPVALLALNRAGIMSASRLRRSWRGAVVLCAIAAAALPGTDPVTTLLEMAPLLILYGLSIVLVTWVERRRPLPPLEPDDGPSMEPEETSKNAV
ncbi:MAG TPA: twin-arginine translocase subunit TatC [Solirubrobacteraceae bacterium]|nr:twin-arginine translocase subunit TatC [Solirubrobacteraceae bacterium]